jgi:hypothetical protein
MRKLGAIRKSGIIVQEIIVELLAAEAWHG